MTKDKPNYRSEGEDPADDLRSAYRKEFVKVFDVPYVELVDRAQKSSEALDAQLEKLEEAGGTNRPEVAFAKEAPKAQILAAQNTRDMNLLLRREMHDENLDQRDRHHQELQDGRKWDWLKNAALITWGTVLGAVLAYLLR